EEVAEHNIFNEVGGINATAGGELTLKQNSAYPIGTYAEIGRDPINSLLNSLSTLGDEDGIGIQILIRPADEGWASRSKELAKKKRQGKSSKGGFMESFGWFVSALEAFWKPPEQSGSKPGEGLSNYEESLVASVEEKTRKPGFETMIRVVTSSNVADRS